jgi:hypothetical protein
MPSTDHQLLAQLFRDCRKNSWPSCSADWFAPKPRTTFLNSDSAVAVHFEQSTRRIEVLPGEAFFQVARDPARPFIAAGRYGEVRAVGTAFTVRQSEEKTDTKITKDNSGLEGNGLANAALNSGSLWFKYDVNGYAADERPSFGVGVFAAGPTAGRQQKYFPTVRIRSDEGMPTLTPDKKTGCRVNGIPSNEEISRTRTVGSRNRTNDCYEMGLSYAI